MEHFQIIVVGTGPSAAAFLSSTKVNNYKTCIVSTGIDYKYAPNYRQSSQSIYNLHDISDKSYFGQTDATSLNLACIEGLNIYGSYMFGGLSNIWGGAIGKYDLNTIYECGLPNETINYLNIIEEKLTGSKINNNYWKDFKFDKIFKSKLAVNTSLCSKCGSCLSGCYLNCIYNAKYEFQKNNELNIIAPYMLLSFKSEKNKVICKLINLENNETLYISCNKLILATGAIPLMSILAASSEKYRKFTLRDSQCTYAPFLVYEDNDFVNELELTFGYIHSIVGDHIIHTQLYKIGEFILNRARKKFFIPKFLNPFIFKNLMIMQNYLPSSKSGYAVFNNNNNKIKVAYIEKYNNKYLSETFAHLSAVLAEQEMKLMTLLKSKLPLFQGYHYGALQINDEKESFDTITGNVLFTNNVHVIDSSIFKGLPSSPLTALVMSNALRIAEDIL